MSITFEERERLRLLAAIKAAEHANALVEHLKLPLGERLRRSMELSEAAMVGGPVEPRDDHPERFYDLARARGMYEG